MPADVPTTGPNVTGPTERPPVEPILATQHTAAGAEAFAEFFVRTIDWGEATISGAYMRHYSDPACTSCFGIAHDLDADRRAGHSYIGGRSTILSARPGDGGPLRSQVVSVRSTAFEEVDRTGQPISSNPAYSRLSYAVVLRWSSGKWLVQKVAVTDMVDAQ